MHLEHIDFARAAIAADRARWGRLAIEPVPVADLPPRIGHVLRLAEIIREVDGNHDKGAAALAEAILSHAGSMWRPAIEPVLVSERLPGPEDCFPGDYGQRSYKCWAQQYHTDSNGEPLQTVAEAWDLVDYRLLPRCYRWYYAWLPHHALPVPTTRKDD